MAKQIEKQEVSKKTTTSIVNQSNEKDKKKEEVIPKPRTRLNCWH